MYLALARKYRPQGWAAVVGQEHVTVTLANAIQAQRLHHAYLFCGARGVGKTTVARILAKAINCTARATGAEPCNLCPSCVDITEGRALDVREIDGASNTGVDDVRELREHLKYLPTGEHFKIYIIDEVHMLSTAAFNALLKTLEEPPPHICFIFATTEPHKIPATILSRCQRYDFRRLGSDAITATLQDIAQREGYAVGPEVLALLAYEAEGGLRDAESLLDQVVAYCGGDITIAKVRGLLGFTDRSTVWALVSAICARDARTALAHLGTVYQSGGNLQRVAQEILEVLRRLWLLASCQGDLPSAEAVATEELAALRSLAQAHGLAEWQQWFAVWYRGADDVLRGQTPKLALEALILRMVQLGPVESVTGLMERVEALMTTSPPARATAPIRPSTGVTVAATATATITAPTAPLQWEPFATWLQQAHPRLASIVVQGTVRTLDAQRLVLQFPNGSLYAEMLKEPERAQQLQEVVYQRLGAQCRLEVRSDDGPNRNEQRTQERTERSERRRVSQQEALDHPVVKDAAAILGAEVKEVKVLDG